jgi:hypothetical protein
MSHYGPLADLVTGVISLAAASASIIATFTKRAKWQPPEEIVPSAVSRLSALLTAVGIANLWAYREQLGVGWLSAITVGGVAVSLVALTVAIHTNIECSYFYPAQKTEKNRKLGGDKLTAQAQKIQIERGLTSQAMFEDAQGDKDLVWTRASQATASVRSTLSFVLLIAAGSCALAAAALLLSGKLVPAA